jgi:hypothetical protein
MSERRDYFADMLREVREVKKGVERIRLVGAVTAVAIVALFAFEGCKYGLGIMLAVSGF